LYHCHTLSAQPCGMQVPETRASLEVAAEEDVAVQLLALRLAKQQRADALAAELAKKAGEEEVAVFQDRADELARTAAMCVKLNL
jgi:hypothetical protein